MADVYLGTVTLMAITYAPRGWHACDGSLLSISQNSALFALLGTTYGGDGQSNFALPDLRGRVPVCAGSGPGLSNYTLGQRAGTESVTLTAQNIAPHTHTAALQVVNETRGVAPAQGNYLGTSLTAPASPTPTLVALGGVTVSPNSGGGAPVAIVQPYLALNYYIALQGIFPSRN